MVAISKSTRKNVSFRLSLESIEQLEAIRKASEDTLNERIPIGLELSKAKVIELIIQGAFEDLKENKTKNLIEKDS